MKPLLIVGIDPGATVGYALLDVQGNVIKLGSAKELDLDTLTAKIVEIGIPIAVGCDKAKTPSLVEKLAVKVGAKLVWPDEDIKVDEKRDLTKNFSFKNDHELDALASALFAFKKSQGLFRRIDKFLAGKNKSELADRVKELVVKKGIHVSGALGLLLEPEQKEVKIVKSVVEGKRLDEKDFLKVYNELKKSEDDQKRLKQQNIRLQDQLKKAAKELEYYKKKTEKIPKTPFDDKLRFKEDKIKFLDDKLRSKENDVKLLKNEIKKLYAALANIESKLVAKKLQNLGWNEFLLKKDILRIRKGDVLFVGDPNSFSDKALEQLRGVVDIIIHKKDVGKKLENAGFVFISADLLDFEENDFFVFVNRGSFEEARRNKQLLKNIIETYKKERSI